MNRLVFALGGAAAVLVLAVMALGLFGQRGAVGPPPEISSPTATTSAPRGQTEAAPTTPTATAAAPSTASWTGPVRSDAADMPVVRSSFGKSLWPDNRDAPTAWVDLTKVGGRGPGWALELAAKPPLAAELDRSVTLLEYGLVFETTGDSVPDYLVGISNDAPRAGDFRVWVSDLATGTTDEQVGPTYGIPVEFLHPDESDEPQQRTLQLWFLDQARPRGLGAEYRYYAWASHTENGEVVSWDYAPDFGWLEIARQP